jgi:hypothetical protein
MGTLIQYVLLAIANRYIWNRGMVFVFRLCVMVGEHSFGWFFLSLIMMIMSVPGLLGPSQFHTEFLCCSTNETPHDSGGVCFTPLSFSSHGSDEYV